MTVGITFQLEGWEQYYSDPDREALWQEYYDEFRQDHAGKMKMGPDIAVYQQMESMGVLQITVVREEGRMVGYCSVTIRPHIHYSNCLCAFEDTCFLTHRLRMGMTGYKLLKFSLERARERGAIRAYYSTRKFLPLIPLFTRLGMEESSSIYTIWLNQPSKDIP